MDGTRNDNAFVLGTEKVFERSESQGCDVVGLGFMPMHTHNQHHHQLPSLSSSSTTSCYHDEGFDHGVGGGGGGPIICNTSNQEACRGDIYDVVGVLKSLHNHHHSFSADSSFPHNSSGEMAAAPVNTRVPFTAAQRQELERQTMIYKYMMASAPAPVPVPVPAELLIPITRNHSNAIKGSLELGFSSSNSSDPEPWRCRRTDGKKWRCSRDVAPDQKYCERHSHKSRPRSRKHVETPSHSSSINNNDNKLQTLNNNNMASDGTKQPTHQNPHFMNHNDASLFTFDQSRCLEWFVKGEATTNVPFTTNSNTDWQQFKANEQFISNTGLGTLGGSLNLNHQTVHSQETRAFIDAWSIADREVVGIGTKLGHVSSNEKLLTLSMSGGNENNRDDDDKNGNEMGGFGDIGGLGIENVRGLRPPPQTADGPSSWMGSSPGGPLAEALCLGLASSQTTSTSSCSKST